MNCPSRTDDVVGREGWNQSPSLLAGTTREDFNGRANTRFLRRVDPDGPNHEVLMDHLPDAKAPSNNCKANATGRTEGNVRVFIAGRSRPTASRSPTTFSHLVKVAVTYCKFIGPGFMISVAYIDPGNYSTDVAAGGSYRFKLLFVVLLANIFAIYLQSLCIKLGTISGMDLAQMCRAHLPKWLNLFLYILAEAAIIATDIAEVIGTAIGINLLVPRIPLVAGCALSILDVLLILLFYRPKRSMKGLRIFEMGVMALVLGVTICFCIELSLIKNTPVGEVFRGYLPSSAIIQATGLYQSCGILGATVMPHSLYLGSGIVQPRLLEFDIKNGYVAPQTPESEDSTSASETKVLYLPSLPAIKHSMKYSILELSVSLFTFALFVNSAILVVAGASLSSVSDIGSTTLFSIHDLLSTSLAPAAGTVFALALLFSGISAGIICTIAGQMVSEGALNWSMAPWLRRLITRSISITPSIIIAGAVGKDGLTAALNGTQVALSVALPFVSAPIIYFTSRNKYMTVSTDRSVMEVHDEDVYNAGNGGHEEAGAAASDGAAQEPEARIHAQQESTRMRNHWVSIIFGVLVWLLIAVMNITNIVLLGLSH